MALHNTINCPGFTENLYRAYKAGEDAGGRYSRTKLRIATRETPLKYTEAAASGAMPPHAFINGMIVPENRELLDPDTNRCRNISRAIPESGNMPYRNMNKTVNPNVSLAYLLNYYNDTEHCGFLTNIPIEVSDVAVMTHGDVYAMYRAGKLLHQTDIDALRANKLAIKTADYLTVCSYTGYLQMYEDAIYQFKEMYRMLVNKSITVEDSDGNLVIYTVRNIVHDYSKLLKRCSNSVITEAVTLGIECGVKSEGSTSTRVIYITHNTYDSFIAYLKTFIYPYKFYTLTLLISSSFSS